jgi:hypothetical protein
VGNDRLANADTSRTGMRFKPTGPGRDRHRRRDTDPIQYISGDIQSRIPLVPVDLDLDP